MYKLILRGLSRVFFHTARFFLRFIEAVAPRTYMPLYLWLLTKYGLKLNGLPRYIATKVRIDEFSLVTLGNRVVISENVTFLTHDYSLTTGLIAIDRMPATDQAFLKNIVIGNNVFVGMGSIIMLGTNIGDNVVVGAGSVVKGLVPSDSIIAGNPAVVVAKLTDQSVIWLEKMEASSLRIDKK